MPNFLVIGTGKDTDRKRQRTFEASDEVQARALAEAEGTVVETVKLLPADLATEKQLAYAKDLGISVLLGSTKEEVSDQLSAHLGKDKVPDKRHFSFADRYSVRYTRFTGKRELYNRIHLKLSEPGRELELTSWFVYRVYRHLVEGREQALIDGPENTIIQGIASQLVQDDSVLKSIRRYRGSDLVWFGEWTAPDGAVHVGGSNKSIAYKLAEKCLREIAGSDIDPKKSRKHQSNRGRPLPSQLEQKRGGCLAVIALFSLAVILALGAVSLLGHAVI